MSDFSSRVKKPNADSPYKRPSVLTVVIALLMLGCLLNYISLENLKYNSEVTIDNHINTVNFLKGYVIACIVILITIVQKKNKRTAWYLLGYLWFRIIAVVIVMLATGDEGSGNMSADLTVSYTFTSILFTVIIIGYMFTKRYKIEYKKSN